MGTGAAAGGGADDAVELEEKLTPVSRLTSLRCTLLPAKKSLAVTEGSED